MIICHKGWETYISSEFNDILLQLSKTIKIVYVEDCAEDCIHMRDAPVVLFWETYEFFNKNYYKFNGIKLFFCDDIHYYTNDRKIQRLTAFTNADYILGTYTYLLKEVYNIPENKLFWIPHSYSERFANTSYNSDPIAKVTISGSLTYHYPFRNYCCNVTNKKYLCHIKHPGYKSYPGYKIPNSCLDDEYYSTVTDHYPNILRINFAAFTCSSIYKYVVAKFFEIPASGSLLVADDSVADRLYELGFVPMVHYVPVNIFTYIDVTDDIMNNIQKYETIRRTGYDFVRNHHSCYIRVRCISDFYDSLTRMQT